MLGMLSPKIRRKLSDFVYFLSDAKFVLLLLLCAVVIVVCGGYAIYAIGSYIHTVQFKAWASLPVTNGGVIAAAFIIVIFGRSGKSEVTVSVEKE